MCVFVNIFLHIVRIVARENGSACAVAYAVNGAVYNPCFFLALSIGNETETVDVFIENLRIALISYVFGNINGSEIETAGLHIVNRVKH